MIRTIALILVFQLAVTVSCEKLSCVSACQEALSGLTFGGTDSPDYYVLTCTNTLRAKSIYVCSKHYCTPSDITPGLDALNSSCRQNGPFPLPPYSIISNVTDIANLPTIGVEDRNQLNSVETAVLPTKDLFELALRTIVSRNRQHIVTKLMLKRIHGITSGLPTTIMGKYSRGMVAT